MKLLASTDIALRVLMLLGRQDHPGRNFSVDTIATQLGGLSRDHLHKIVRELSGLGILNAVRGAGGGVSLAKPLDQVRLGWLVRKLEGDQPVVECFREDGGCCVIDPGCRLRAMLRAARDAFYDSLDRHTLADCAKGAWYERLAKKQASAEDGSSSGKRTKETA
jgi:Rrf2 family transcriptional regulator, nitric oxide-sensitive transcriptional repressor